jgi:hypothetical protein
MFSGIRKTLGSIAKTRPELYFIPEKPHSFFRLGEQLQGRLKLVIPQAIDTTSLVAKLEGITNVVICH